MIYPFVTLADETEIVYSHLHDDGTVKVYMEKPIDGGFSSAECVLPHGRLTNIKGYSNAEVNHLQSFIDAKASEILRLSREQAD